MDPLVIAFGLGVGVLVGLTGIGGGSLMTPLLILFAGVPPVVAIGTDLAYGAVTKTLGGWRHLRSGTVDLGVSKWLALGSVPGSVAGVLVVNALHDRYGGGFDGPLLTIIAAVLMVVALTVIGRAVIGIARERHSVPLTAGAKGGAVAIGLVLGLVLGMTSVGSGALVGLALILVFRLTPHRVVGTDVFHAALMLWAAGSAHWITGNVDFALMGSILIGSLPGVWVGSALITRIPAAGLRTLLGCVLLGSALGVLSKSGADVPTWTIVGAPAAVGVLVLAINRLRGPRATPEVAPA